MNKPVIKARRNLRPAQAGAAFFAATLFGFILQGCGGTYKSVVTTVTTTGPASQATAYAAVVSTASTSVQTPAETLSGVATIVDYSGDTVMAQALLSFGPLAIAADSNGSNIYSINSDGTLAGFAISTTLQAKSVTLSTLTSNSGIVNLFAPASGLYATDISSGLDGSTSVIDVLSGSPEVYKQSVTVGTMPVAIGGLTGAQTYWSISQNVTDPMACNNSPRTQTNGEADGVATASLSVSYSVPTGKCPVYSVSSSYRTFVLNRGDDTITVLNTATNGLDYNSSCVWGSSTPCTNQNGQSYYTHPALPLSTAAVGASAETGSGTITIAAPVNGTTSAALPATAGPVYAEYDSTLQELVVANYDSGTVSIIDVSLDDYGNDSQTFGTTYTVKVGNNPASVTALVADVGTRAYVANQTDGTISIVNLTSHTVQKTITVPNGGHPRNVVSIANSEYGKVYIVSPDTNYLAMIRTDEDILVDSIQLPGNIVDARVDYQNGSSGNSNYVSRQAGWGQPCFLPASTIQTLWSTSAPTLSECRSH